MLEITQYFEQVAVQFNAIVLIGLGLAAVLLGLFVWLGGLGLRRPLLAVVGAIGSGACAFFATGRNTALTAVSAGIGAAVAVMFEKVFITILTAALVVVFGLAVFTRPYLRKAEGTTHTNWYEMQNQTQTYNVRQTVEVLKAYVYDIYYDIKHACPQMPLYSWLIIAALVVIFIAAGYFYWPLISAFCCAALGTISIFVGMILLLLYKGSAPVSGICNRVPFYLGVFAAMTAFGTVEQLLLCQRIGKKLVRKKQIKQDKINQETNQ
jgi:hypothetical protein